MMKRRLWSQEELLVALDLYCRIPFGLYHAGNRELQFVAARLGRTPDALAMKLSNFAALDPVHRQRGIKGLKNGAKADEILMNEFLLHPEATIQEASQAFEALGISAETDSPLLPLASEKELILPAGPTEKTRTVEVRIVQRFFRSAVLSSYDFKCAFCELGIHDLLNASHIIPWKSGEAHRADPHNGLSLCAIHDRAFDRGLVSVDKTYKILLSKRLDSKSENTMLRTAFIDLKGESMQVPRRFAPSSEALAYHREHVFQD